MTPEQARVLLGQVARGDATVEEVLAAFVQAPLETTDFATIDHHRTLRQGFPEVIYGAGKTVEQVVGISERLLARGHGVLLTRATGEMQQQLLTQFPDAVAHPVARTVRIPGATAPSPLPGPVMIVTAGTSDLPVADEAHETAIALGMSVVRVTDVGVAGIHRLLSRSAELRQARAVIVVAGMDGALPSVVGGLVSCPVIAVPTSVGYGAAFAGVAPLLTALNSCSAGVVVVNIDNGFGAAMAAARFLSADERQRPQ